jgi:hypothetical protein
VGFSSGTQDRIVATSLERDHGAKGTRPSIGTPAGRLPASWLGALGGEDRFRVSAGNFADSDPADPANE